MGIKKRIFMGLFRHVLTTVGGILIARGTLDAGSVEALIGTLMTIAGSVWSMVDKNQN